MTISSRTILTKHPIKEYPEAIKRTQDILSKLYTGVEITYHEIWVNQSNIDREGCKTDLFLAEKYIGMVHLFTRIHPVFGKSHCDRINLSEDLLRLPADNNDG